MLNRWIGIAALTCMLSANMALLIRDIIPVWFAGDPPRSEFLERHGGEPWKRQYGIFDKRGARIGVSRSIASPLGEIVTLRTGTVLEALTIAPGVTTPRVRVDSTLVFRRSGALDNLKIQVYGLPVDIRLDAELQASGDFPCQWTVGDQTGTFILNERATGSFGDLIRPFDSLPGLFVGKSWRIDVFNPLEQAMPGVSGPGLSTRAILVRVVAEEEFEHRGQVVLAHRVESDNLRAWVAPDGRILRQEVKLPLFETLTLIDEPYDERSPGRR